MNPPLLVKAGRFHVFANIVVADRQFHTDVQTGEHNRFVVEFAEDHAQGIVGVMHLHLHPFALAAFLIGKHGLDEVPMLVLRHLHTSTLSFRPGLIFFHNLIIFAANRHPWCRICSG